MFFFNKSRNHAQDKVEAWPSFLVKISTTIAAVQFAALDPREIHPGHVHLYVCIYICVHKRARDIFGYWNRGLWRDKALLLFWSRGDVSELLDSGCQRLIPPAAPCSSQRPWQRQEQRPCRWSTVTDGLGTGGRGWGGGRLNSAYWGDSRSERRGQSAPINSAIWALSSPSFCPLI